MPELLERLRTGDQSALNEILPPLYDELHRIASRHLRAERPNHTLQATALVHARHKKARSRSGAGSDSDGNALTKVDSDSVPGS